MVCVEEGEGQLQSCVVGITTSREELGLAVRIKRSDGQGGYQRR